MDTKNQRPQSSNYKDKHFLIYLTSFSGFNGDKLKECLYPLAEREKEARQRKQLGLLLNNSL
tara:strand:- start:1357 stop:1542 length:186 start_codon:yes stop_codon:yes gene_type:complete